MEMAERPGERIIRWIGKPDWISDLGDYRAKLAKNHIGEARALQAEPFRRFRRDGP